MKKQVQVLLLLNLVLSLSACGAHQAALQADVYLNRKLLQITAQLPHSRMLSRIMVIQI